MKIAKIIIGIFAAASIAAVACNGKASDEDVRLYANALELYGGGQFSETAELLSEVKFPPALTLRAKAEYFQGDLERAENSSRQAAKLQPAYFESKFILARVLRDRGEYEKARQVTEDLLANNPNDIRLLRFAATLASDRGEAVRAAVLLDKAAELSAEGAMVLLDRARLRWIAGNGEAALEDLSRAEAMLPANTPVSRAINQLEKRITEAMQ